MPRALPHCHTALVATGEAGRGAQFAWGTARSAFNRDIKFRADFDHDNRKAFVKSHVKPSPTAFSSLRWSHAATRRAVPRPVQSPHRAPRRAPHQSSHIIRSQNVGREACVAGWRGCGSAPDWSRRQNGELRPQMQMQSQAADYVAAPAADAIATPAPTQSGAIASLRRLGPRGPKSAWRGARPLRGLQHVRGSVGGPEVPF